MPLRDEVNSMVKENRYEELAYLAMEKKGVIKYVLSLLYDHYGKERWQAIEALGYIASRMSVEEPDTVRELIRRLLWSMNDESGSASWSAPEAIGEIIYGNTPLYQGFIPVVVNASEEEIFQRGILWALGRIAQREPSLVQEFVPLIMEQLGNKNSQVRGYAAWSLGEIGITEAIPILGSMSGDSNIVEVYEEREIKYKSVGQLAVEAVKKIKNREYNP